MSIINQLSARFQSIPVFVKSLGLGCLLVPLVSATAVTASTQLSTTELLDHLFLSDAPMPGASAEEDEKRLLLRETVTQWLGRYEGIQSEDEHYRVLFEQGSIPITVQFHEDGDPASITVVDCPVTSIPISQAPTEYREVLASDCPDLTP